MDSHEASSKFATVRGILEMAYGPRRLRPNGDPLSELISTILSHRRDQTDTARDICRAPAFEAQSATPAGVVTVNARCFPSRDQLRS